ncbi:hypothetical protein EJB05_14310, partial [Eragrostis curvula]
MPNNKMNPKHATLCCLLLVLVLHADHAYAVSTGTCYYSKPWVPFCDKWLCKSECWLETKLIFKNVVVKEHKCIKGGFKG